MSRPDKRNRLRIIAGRWRSRRLAFADTPGLRPTPDRVRETLFNWLQPVIAGARCLDLFAGSGALGFEAASRGAAEVVLVERDRAAVQCLRTQVANLDARGVQVVWADALSYLQQPGRPFDVVFLDPPYGSELLGPCCERLEAGGWLSMPAHIYLETRIGQNLPPLPPSWRRVRSQRAGQVNYHLAVRDAHRGPSVAIGAGQG